MLMNPPYFLPRTNWRGTTTIGVGEDNTRPSITWVLDQLTGGEGVCFLEQTIWLAIIILSVYIMCHITHSIYIYTQNHKYTVRVVQYFFNRFNYPWNYIQIYTKTWGLRGGGGWVNRVDLVKPVSWLCCVNHYPSKEDRDSTIWGISGCKRLSTQ